MKTAEEILTPYVKSATTGFGKYLIVDKHKALEAMEEHAKQVTIEFMKYLGMSESKEGKTFEGIYEEFLEK